MVLLDFFARLPTLKYVTHRWRLDLQERRGEKEKIIAFLLGKYERGARNHQLLIV